MKTFVILFLFCIFYSSNAQSVRETLSDLETQLAKADEHRQQLSERINQQKWTIYNQDLKSYGLPSPTYLEHTAYFFEYSEEHEQAQWVAHMITPEVKELGSGRTNDFRVDPLVLTGTADSIDYYNYHPQRKESKRYEGFGYDRGHLAPSADFRWYSEAVSESYYYSNMSPQHPDFNRKVWADLEGLLRKYVITNQVSLAVITAPILTDDLAKITESPNGVSIPKQFIKIAYDATNDRSIAFLMENKELPNPPSYYAMTIDDVEEITGYNYFPNIDETIETSIDIAAWFEESLNGDAIPIKQELLPFKHFNTITGVKQAKSNKVINVCGTVVGTRHSRKGHAWLNLDKKYPNQIFSIMIRKEKLINYPFDPTVQYKDQKLCFEGKVEKWGDMVVMQVKKPDLITTLKNKL